MTLIQNQMRVVSERGFALVLTALIGLAAAACGDTPQTPQAPPELLEMQSDMTGYETDTYLTKNGIRSAQIHADSAFYFDDSTAVHMYGVEMEVYDEPAGAVKATVTAERGRYDPRTQGMHAEGNVVLIMPSQSRRVESPELWYEPVDERIWSDSASTYHHDGQITRGTCFKSDLTFKNYTVCNIRGAADVGGGA
jgi:LPS export ABC transporter protein LptC